MLSCEKSDSPKQKRLEQLRTTTAIQLDVWRRRNAIRVKQKDLNNKLALGQKTLKFRQKRSSVALNKNCDFSIEK